MPDTKGYPLIGRSALPEEPKKANQLQENVRYWVVIDRDGLGSSLHTSEESALGHMHSSNDILKWENPHAIVRVTLKAVSDD